MAYRCIPANNTYTSIVFLTSFPIPLQDSFGEKDYKLPPGFCEIKNPFPPDYKGRHHVLDDRPSVNVKSASEKGILS